jgi:GntR family transcriptional repressor for pyruvate dehydrogenase complex
MSKTSVSPLEPLGSLSMTDRVENILRAYFAENKFKPGDSLPNEIEIANQLNVSRNVVREALSRLRMLGMIEARPRRGMIMGQPDVLASLEKVMNPLILSIDNLKDIFEMRLILEMGIAEFLFARKKKKDIEELEGIVARQKHKVVLSRVDEITFHGKLYEMTGNETFTRFQTLLMPVFDHVFSEYYDKGVKVEIPEPVSHQDLVDILKEGTADQFRKAMYTHLMPYYWSGNITPRSSKR